jgi:hypothetical protein
MKGTSFDGTSIDLSYLQSDLTGWAAISFARDSGDSRWPFVAALIVALLVVVLGSLCVIVLNAGRRARTPPREGRWPAG